MAVSVLPSILAFTPYHLSIDGVLGCVVHMYKFSSTSLVTSFVPFRGQPPNFAHLERVVLGWYVILGRKVFADNG